MASVYGKKINGKTYYYLREMARVDGKPKMVSERYLGSAADIEAAIDGVQAGMVPDRTRHLRFGDVAAVWSLLSDLDVAGVIDDVVGARRSDAGASPGTYLALAALGRLVEPGSKRAFANWWAATAADRFTRISASVLDHRKFWDAMHAVDADMLQEISARLTAAMIARFELDLSSVALDMTNFATYIDTTNDKAPIAQRGKAKQKRNDLRLVGLGLVVTRAGGIPLAWHAYPGNRPDVTLIDHLAARFTHLTSTSTGAATADGGDGQAPAPAPAMTVVFDAGQNSDANFAHLTGSGLHYVGSVPPSDCPDLLALPAAQRTPVARIPRAERDRHPARRLRRHPPGRAHPLGVPARRPGPLLHRHHPGQSRAAARRARRDPGPRQNPPHPARRRGRDRRHHPRPVAAPGYRHRPDRRHPRRAPAELERQQAQAPCSGKRGVRQTDPAHRPRRLDRARRRRRLPLPIRDRVRVPATQRPPPGLVLADVPLDRAQHRRAHLHLRARPATGPPDAPQSAHRAGHEMSVRAILDTLAGIGETVLLYPSTGGRPKARRMTTDMTADQHALYDLYDLHRWAPASTT